MGAWFDITRFAPGPVYGVLCVVFLLLVPWIWFDARGRRGRATVRFSSVAGLGALPIGWRQSLWFFPPLIRTAAVLALVFALARPQSVGRSHDRSEGIAIEMVLDVSGSMAEPDFVMDGAPARRLDAVKRVFRDFVLGSGDLPGRPNDLIGMTTFAMYADVRGPLTLDHGNLGDLLREADIPGYVHGKLRYQHPEANHTALGDAIALATNELRKAGEQAAAGVPGAEPARSRVMILLTDGANNPAPQFAQDAPKPIEAARLAAKFGIKIYTIGAIGSPGQRRRGFFGAFAPRAEVDEPTLRAIAQATGGRYFRATNTDSLRTIYQEIDQLERHRTGDRVYNDDTHAARLAMLVGLALLFAELCLRELVFGALP